MNPGILEFLSRAHEVKLVADGMQVPVNFGLPTKCVAEVESAPGGANEFRFRDGEWSIRFNDRLIRRKDGIGRRYIHELLKAPGGVTLAIELFRKQNSIPGKSTAEFEAGGYVEGNQSIQSDVAEEILPNSARARMWRELKEMEEELIGLREGGDLERIIEKEDEIQELKDHLRRASFRGHNARFPNQLERNRKSVSLAIARAIEDLKNEHPALARHLDNSIQTGKECSYNPETHVPWTL